MARSFFAALLLLIAATGCGGDEANTTAAGASTTAPPAARTFEPATSGTLVRWYETPGECQECGFTLELDAAGTATFVGHEAEATVTYDVAELRDRLAEVHETPLVVGADDCGREVDGNAPVLELIAAGGDVTTVDDCFETIDREHPAMDIVISVLDDARAAAGVG